MTELSSHMASLVLVGIGATLLMDIWALVLTFFKIPSLNYAYVGRWLGHMCKGSWRHDSIAKSQALKGELALGWIMHYMIGIVFSIVLVMIVGETWLNHPTYLPALVMGVSTASVPLFIVQPALGAGTASSKTAAPWINRIKTIITHMIFGAGLYFAGLLLVFWME